MITVPETVMRSADPDTDDSLCHVSWQARPGSFVSLMTLYESNYIRLAWLVSNVETIDGAHVSTVPGDCPLHLVVEDRSRYTTTLSLTYLFDTDEGVRVADPDLQIRIYHDARLAEVKQCSRWHRHEVLKALSSQARDAQQQVHLAQNLGDRWQRNMMLNKWLDYCVERGHSF